MRSLPLARAARLTACAGLLLLAPGCLLSRAHWKNFDRSGGRPTIESAFLDEGQDELLLRLRYPSGELRDVAAPFAGRLAHEESKVPRVDGRVVTIEGEPTGRRLEVVGGLWDTLVADDPGGDSSDDSGDGFADDFCVAYVGRDAEVYADGLRCASIDIPEPSPWRWDRGSTYSYLGLAPLYLVADIITLPAYPLVGLMTLIWPGESPQVWDGP